jgi:type IV secretion system protein VirB10
MNPENPMPKKSETGNGSVQLGGTVENKVAKPAGLLPKNTQQLVILGVAVVMILVMWLSGGAKHASKASTPLSGAQVQAPNPATVEDFKQTMQRQQAATRQPISPSNLERLKALGLAGDIPTGGSIVAPSDATIPQPGGVVGGATGQAPPPDPIKEDKKKREYLSLFAPNLAFTSRKVQGETHSVDPAVLPADAQARLVTETISPSATPSIGETHTNAEVSSSSTIGTLLKRYVAFEGTVLETLLINRLNGTFAGPVNCLVTIDVYSHDRQHVLIPAGTKVLGEAKKVEAFGQQRPAVFFHRLLMPDGYSVNLDQFKGLSQAGEPALRDKVNNHYLQIFGASLAVGILGGIAEVGTGNVLTNSTLDRAREGFGGSMANSSINILDRFLNILPTVTIREGNRVKVYLSGDLLLPDYSEHTLQPDL